MFRIKTSRGYYAFIYYLLISVSFLVLTEQFVRLYIDIPLDYVAIVRIGFVFFSIIAILIYHRGIPFKRILSVYILFIMFSVVANLESSQPLITIVNTYAKLSLWIYFYFLSFIMSKELGDKYIIKILIGFFIILIFVFYFLMFSSLVDGNTSYFNFIFYPLLCIPVLLHIKNNILRLTSIILLVMGAIITMKLTAILIVLLVVLSLLIKNIILNLSRRRKLIRIMFIFISLVVIIITSSSYLRENFIAVSLSLINQLGTGRILIWGSVIDLLRESSFYQVLLGHGFEAVSNDYVYGLSAHNDFLEIIYDFGLISLVIYILYHIRLLVFMIKSRVKGQYRMGLLFAFYIILVMSSFSHLIIYPTYHILVMLYIGAFTAQVIEKSVE